MVGRTGRTGRSKGSVAESPTAPSPGHRYERPDRFTRPDRVPRAGRAERFSCPAPEPGWARSPRPCCSRCGCGTPRRTGPTPSGT
ncbi:hypothetical protein B9W62_17080 [Streptomyces sp. CS113]|nr:hypothetical protein B9W62_17080 [Streptomyces sp. CS113]